MKPQSIIKIHIFGQYRHSHLYHLMFAYNHAKMIDVINYPGTLSDIENRDFIYVYATCKNTGSTINAKLQTCHAI